jgi:NAD+ synthase (glutamine-hydrolysing)
MQRVLRVALAQINPTVGALVANSEKIVNFIKQAQGIGADIVAFPELSICGYPPEDLLLKEHFVRDNLKILEKLEQSAKDVVAIIGFADKDRQGNLYNAAAIVGDGKLKGIYRKIELPNYGVFDEKRYFKPGEKILTFALGDVIFGVNICEDIWEEKGVAWLQAKKGAKVIINISASPYYAGKLALRKKMLTQRAKETGTYICYVNLVGGQDELVFDGSSFVIGPEGKLKTGGKQFDEDLVVADLEIKIRGKLKPQRDDCIRLGQVSELKKPRVPRRKHKILNRVNEIYNALVLGTRDYLKKNGFEKAVIGLSGGIDSSLTAVIVCDAVGAQNVIGVSMPGRYSSEATQSDARTLAQNLKIRFIVVPIDTIFDAYLTQLKKEFSAAPPDVTEENLQARLRGNILMALSNKFGWLVITTGNKSEISVGYCTLYGDMVGGFGVIKDVPKTLVYRLAKFANQINQRMVIPQSVFQRAPSAELRENQKDEDSLPPYPVLDTILKKYVEEDRGFEEIASSVKLDRKIIKEVIRMVDKNEYKRRQAAPGIKITPKAFGKDRRLPITNRYTQA